jgi:hypothetical protein
MVGKRLLASGSVAAFFCAVLSCEDPTVQGHACAADGQCPAGLRCRLGICIPLGPEVCNGEDDNGDGLIDENLYLATPWSVSLPAPRGTLKSYPVLAQSGNLFLMAWGASDASPWELQYALVDWEGRSISDVRIADDGVGSAVAFAASGTPSGFVLAYNPAPEVRVVRIDEAGMAAPPETLGGNYHAATLGVAWQEDAPAVALWHEGCSGAQPCEPAGLIVLRAGQAPMRLADGSGDLSIAAGGASLGVAWTTCLAAPADGGCASAGSFAGSAVELRVITAGSVAMRTIPKALGISIAWSGDELHAAWQDLSNPLAIRLVHGRFDAAAQPISPDGTVLRVATLNEPVFGTALAMDAEEGIVAWTDSSAGRGSPRSFFARFAPPSAYAGEPAPFDSGMAQVYAVFALGRAYRALLFQPPVPAHVGFSFSDLSFQRIECAMGPPLPGGTK